MDVLEPHRLPGALPRDAARFFSAPEIARQSDVCVLGAVYRLHKDSGEEKATLVWVGLEASSLL